MKKIVALVIVFAFIYGCTKSPITGRKQMFLYPESQMIALSLVEYGNFLNQATVVNNASTDAQQVKRVGNAIAAQVETYYKSKGWEADLEGYEWEFNLVDDPAVNAWAMPGGKVVVYTGLLPIAKNDDGLAVVMGHEIVHALHRHGNERMSQMMMAQLGGVALEVATANKPSQTRQIYGMAYGLGVQVGALLPFGRTQETESDQFGLRYSAMAGYNPEEAVPFWQRMGEASGGGAPPEFLSTHPSHDTRIQNMQEKFIPGAMVYYRPNNRPK